MKFYSAFRSFDNAPAGRMRRKTWQRYSFGVACVAVALWLQLGVSRYVSVRDPFPLFYIALAFATWVGGSGVGVLALVLGYFVEDWFIAEPHHLEIVTPTWVIILEGVAYGLVGSTI